MKVIDKDGKISFAAMKSDEGKKEVAKRKAEAEKAKAAKAKK